MIGIDQAFYCRFIRGCWWFTLLHTFTTLPVLLTINLALTPPTKENPTKSMTRASLSQLIASPAGLHLLWIHQLALYWLLATWLFVLWWLGRGLWRWRERAIERARRALNDGVSVLSPAPLPQTRREKKGKKESSRAPESQIRHQQEGDLESSLVTIRGEPLPPSVYNHDPTYSDVGTAPYQHIHALHPLPPSAHPHTPYAPSPSSAADRGLRLRTVMVSNVPVGMRSESELKEYFEYYMSKPILVPPITPGFLPRIFNWFLHRKPARAAAKRVMGDNVKRISKTNPVDAAVRRSADGGVSTPPNGALRRDGVPHEDSNPEPLNDPRVGFDFGIIDSRPESPNFDPNAPPPIIERVIICRKMTELTSRLERREQYLRKLEAAHCKLANKALEDVRDWIESGGKLKRSSKRLSRASTRSNSKDDKGKLPASPKAEDLERGPDSPVQEVVEEAKEAPEQDGDSSSDEEFDEEKEQARMELLARELGPFVEEFYPDIKAPRLRRRSRGPNSIEAKWKAKFGAGYDRVSREGSDETGAATYPPNGQTKETPNSAPDSGETSPPRTPDGHRKTIWHVLHALPRSYLDPYQPLVSLSTLFRGATAPAIDYYHAKVGLLTSLISENRSTPQRDLIPTSTAFVTFHSPQDARRCVRYLANHPDNLLACIVEPAPDWRDLDWHRIGRSTFTGEFLRDWIVKAGVWGFTLFWIIPVGALVALVSVDKISSFIPGLASYFDAHPYQKEVITAFLPTLIVALLAILVPMLLLLIGKQAHTILTLSRLHDTIMVRYYKFLVCNVLVFFCIGTTTLNAILDQIKLRPGGGNVQQERTDFVKIVATSFPNAAPFYVGWLVFQTAMHSGLELGLYGLPLLVYPGTRASTTLRRREVGIRPRTYNFYYWLPNHVMVMMIVIVFTILNPLVIPFSLIYFGVAVAVHKNQLMRVYSKWYDQKGTILYIRILRYSLDGFLFAEIVFLALNILTKRSNPGHEADVIAANFGLTGILLIVTTAAKIYLTTVLRSKFDALDVKEADVYHNTHQVNAERGIPPPQPESISKHDDSAENAGLLANTQGSPKVEEDLEPKVDYHPGSVRLWNWKLPTTEEDVLYRTLPGHFAARPLSPRAAIPFDLGDGEPVSDGEGMAKHTTVPSRSPPRAYARRWSVGAVGVGGVTFPKELTDALESPTSPTSPLTATSVAPLLAHASAMEHARQSMERGQEATIRAVNKALALTEARDGNGLDAHGRGRPGMGRATISFDTPPIIIREKKPSITSSSAPSAASRAASSRGSSSLRSWIDLQGASPQNPRSQSSDPLPPLIRPHPKTGPWDDAPRYDIPYHNPAYTCTLDDFLWLPRNPCGKLNLDDSIEMRKAIRTEAHLGAMGEWVDDGSSFDVIPRNTVASVDVAPGTVHPDKMTVSSAGGAQTGSELVGTDDANSGAIPLSRRITIATTSSVAHHTQKLLSGMEHIHLPAGIRARVSKKAADEFGFRRKKQRPPPIMLSPSAEEIEQSEGAAIEEEARHSGYFTIRDRRPSTTIRPVLRMSGSGRYPHSPSGGRTEGHASTSTLGVNRRPSSRSIFSRYSSAATTHSNVSAGGESGMDVTLDPALMPDISTASPFLGPELQIVMTRRSTLGLPTSPRSTEALEATDPRRTHSMFVPGEPVGEGAGVAGPLSPSDPTHELGMRRMRSHGGISAISRAGNRPGSSVLGGGGGRRRGGSLSIRDAIVGEVLAEEQVATAKRLQEEIQDAERAAGPRSYWTGWMWRQVPNNAHVPHPPISLSEHREQAEQDAQLHHGQQDQHLAQEVRQFPIAEEVHASPEEELGQNVAVPRASSSYRDLTRAD